MTHRMCVRCVMDSTDPDITFDSDGVCSHCHTYDQTSKRLWKKGEEGRIILEKLLGQIKKEGQGKRYDAIIGLSGGTDSSYLAYLGHKWGLRMLAVHVDAGWNTEIAVQNIENICNKLNIDLITEVIDWTDMQAMQRAFFRSKVVNQDIPQDHAFFAALYKYSTKNKIKYVLNGYNIASESCLPLAWRGNNAMDVTHIKAIYAKYGDRPLRHYPFLSVWKLRFWYRLTNALTMVSPLNLIDYDKLRALDELKSAVGFVDYGGKHHESVLTRFQQLYFLPTIYGYEKRKAHLSSLILSGQLSREQAIKELETPLYPNEVELNNDIEYFVKKIGITRSEFDAVMSSPPDRHENFPNEDNLNRRFDQVSEFLRKLVSGKQL